MAHAVIPAAGGMALVRVMHERVVNGARMTLAVYEREGGERVYGVALDGGIQMCGTKAEAKAYYGNERKTW